MANANQPDQAMANADRKQANPATVEGWSKAWISIAGAIVATFGLISAIIGAFKSVLPDLRFNWFLPRYSIPTFIVLGIVLYAVAVLIDRLWVSKKAFDWRFFLPFFDYGDPEKSRYAVYARRCFLFSMVACCILILFQAARLYDAVHTSTATVYAGTFPSNIASITNMLDDAESEVLIACDRLAYGCVSAPQEHQNYQSVINKLAADGKSITIKTFSLDKRKSAARQQHGVTVKTADEAFAKIKDSASYQEYVKNKSKDPQSFEELLSMIEKDDEEPFSLKLSGRKNVDLQACDGVSVFLWIKDRKEAIFSFHNLGGSTPSEVSFRTKDPNFVAILIDLFNSYNENAP